MAGVIRQLSTVHWNRWEIVALSVRICITFSPCGETRAARNEPGRPRFDPRQSAFLSNLRCSARQQPNVCARIWCETLTEVRDQGTYPRPDFVLIAARPAPSDTR